MTTSAHGTRVGLVRARFEEIPDVDLGTAGYLLAGLDGLFALEWLIDDPASRVRLDDAPSPVLRSVGLNAPLEVSMWASADLGMVHQAGQLVERIHCSSSCLTSRSGTRE